MREQECEPWAVERGLPWVQEHHLLVGYQSLRKIKSPKSEEVRESVFVGVAGISISNPFTRIQAKLVERDGALQRQRDR